MRGWWRGKFGHRTDIRPSTRVAPPNELAEVVRSSVTAKQSSRPRPLSAGSTRSGVISIFYSPGARLAIEVDGSGHDVTAQMRHDSRRDAVAFPSGIDVLACCWPSAARRNIGRVLRTIEALICRPPRRAAGGTLPAKRGEPTPEEAGIEITFRALVAVFSAIALGLVAGVAPPPAGEALRGRPRAQ